MKDLQASKDSLRILFFEDPKNLAKILIISSKVFKDPLRSLVDLFKIFEDP